eukprot:1856130-Prorocentrum_lima.AAC.1
MSAALSVGALAKVSSGDVGIVLISAASWLALPGCVASRLSSCVACRLCVLAVFSRVGLSVVS